MTKHTLYIVTMIYGKDLQRWALTATCVQSQELRTARYCTKML